MRLRGGAGRSSRSGRCWASPGSWIPRKASTLICEGVPRVRVGQESPAAKNRGGAASSPAWRSLCGRAVRWWCFDAEVAAVGWEEVRGAAAVPIKGIPGLLACAPGVDSGDRGCD